MEIFVHRGGRINSNTISAFQKCVDLGVDGIEVDLSMSKDGEPMIYHPELVEPVTQDPLYMSWRSIRQDYPQIPHLNDLIEFLNKNPKLQCLLDVKIDSQPLRHKIRFSSMQGTTKENKKKVVLHSPAFKQIYVTSPRIRMPLAGLHTNVQVLLSTRVLMPQIQIHIIEIVPTNRTILRGIRKYSPLIVSFGWLPNSPTSRLLFYFLTKTRLLDLRQLQSLRGKGVRLMGGIVNTEEELRYFVDFQEYAPPKPLVDIILTDEPEMALKFRKNLKCSCL